MPLNLELAQINLEKSQMSKQNELNFIQRNKITSTKTDTTHTKNIPSTYRIFTPHSRAFDRILFT